MCSVVHAHRGAGPRIWFHVMPDAKVVKNRLHLDIHASGSRSVPLATRAQRVDAEAWRLANLGATLTGSWWPRASITTRWG
jgi:hypothetical protein